MAGGDLERGGDRPGGTRDQTDELGADEWVEVVATIYHRIAAESIPHDALRARGLAMRRIFEVLDGGWPEVAIPTADSVPTFTSIHLIGMISQALESGYLLALGHLAGTGPVARQCAQPADEPGPTFPGRPLDG
jgi:hypothetical protein